MQTNQKMTTTQPDNTPVSEIKFPKPMTPPPPPPLLSPPKKEHHCSNQLNTISERKLLDNVYEKSPPLIEGLLYTGAYLLVGSPKIGKSFFVAQLAFHISSGKPLWNYPVRQSGVIYLALEDDYGRLQERFFRMFGTNSTDNLLLAVASNSLYNGLIEQLTEFMETHKDTRLIIIDTLQKIRDAVGENYSYANDYDVIGQLKQFADTFGVCLLIVHHTRKQGATDKFDMISGTNGLLGAADGAFILTKESRTSNKAILDISGRDQQDIRLNLIRNEVTLCWELESVETELWADPPDPLLETVAGLVNESNPEWQGTATELAEVLNTELAPNKLTRHLNACWGKLFNEYHIRYKSSKNHEGRIITLKYEVPEPPPVTIEDDWDD